MKHWIEQLKQQETEKFKETAREQSYTKYPITLRLIAEIEHLENLMANMVEINWNDILNGKK